MAWDKIIRDDALGREDLRTEFGWSLSAQQRARERGDFPPGYRMGGRLYWRRDVVLAWIAEQEAKAAQQVSV
jgi:hypothetical protein